MLQTTSFSVLEDQYSMDSDYIKRYLGELTPVQESRLMQLRKWIADLQKGKVPSDTTLLRFLRARDFSVEKAREMLSQSLLWRKKHQVDRILSEYQTPDVVKQYFPGGWHHHDKDGRPLYILRLGQMDVKGLLKSIGEDGLLKLTLHVCEEGLKLLEEATRSSEHAIQSWCLLVDLDGLNMRHLWRPGVRALLRIIQIVEANYPETMGRVLIVRAPRVFPILWTIVSTFIDENTRSKFLFYGGKDYLQQGGLLDYIPKDLIPDFLGGPCKSFVHEGGLVPKSLYVSGAFTERDGDPLSEDSIYRSVSLGKGQVHEVIVQNRDPQSVLTWDFDVLRHDISFTVYRSDRALDHPDRAAADCVGGVSAEETRSVLDGCGWREGEHYHRVEPTLVCHDGESIQGSHVMSESGSYVLQWRCEAADGSRAAQLMYFHETLASHHYR
ncbi:jg11714 [Pararge aegeria aegeria]|uniref:Jg11714 protein n=1 Tax=Pararge aegeria aegeria TaxID=348720 RepID=A0A8S4RZY7_9NEOP|nr:jg11714 [Pararge aegeria aegeria]